MVASIFTADSGPEASEFAQADAALIKILVKLLGRIERQLLPVGSIEYSPLPEMFETFVRERVRTSAFFYTSEDSGRRLIDWEALYEGLYVILSFGKGEGYVVPPGNHR